MGTDITSLAEVRQAGAWTLRRNIRPDAWREEDDVFPYRNYALFGFLADVRNYSRSPVIAEPRGLPGDVSPEVRQQHADHDWNAFSASWLTLAEMQAYDYDQTTWDRRIEREIAPGAFDGAALAHEGEGRHLPLREFLAETGYFDSLDLLAGLGDPADVRVVFWFQS